MATPFASAPAATAASSVELLLTTHAVPSRQAAAELRSSAISANAVRTEGSARVLCSVPYTSLPLLSTLALPERAYAVVGRFALDDATDIAALKSIVSGAKGWPVCLEAWAAIGGGTPKPTSLSVSAKRSGRRFAHIPSMELSGGLGAALAVKFAAKIDLKSTSALQVHALLNDDGLMVTVALLHRPDSTEGREEQPGLHPQVCHALARCAGPSLHGATIVDPMAGRGSLLVEALRLAPTARAVGVDASAAQLAAAARNLQALRLGGAGALASRCALVEGDATRLPLPAASADVVLSDLPFGVQHALEDGLYEAALREMRRVVRDGAGAVVLLTSEANLELLRDSVRAVGGMQLRRWRIVPLGYTRAAVCVIDAVSADAPPAPQPVEVARFDWEFKSGRAGWEVLRKEARPPMVGASSRHR